MATSIAVLGVAVGTALPQSTTVSLLLLTASAGCLAIVVLRDPSLAPLHGLHHVVRLPLLTSAAATVESFRSRLAGTLRTLVGRAAPSPVVLDEPDDDAERWWGISAAPEVPVAPVVPAPMPPEVVLLAPWPPPLPPAPALPAPVLAAPMQSAHVPAARKLSIRRWSTHLVVQVRRWSEPRIGRHRRPTDGAGAST